MWETGMKLRELWDNGAVTLGGWCSIPGAFGAELLGYCGFDWICIDTQHGIIGYDQMVGMLQGLSISGTPSFVRVSWNAPFEIMKALDAGAQGVIVPMINSSDEAAQAVRACKYPPDGIRSYGPTRAALGRSDYSPAVANRETVCAVMVETLEGLANLDQIVTTPGVDAVFVGPNDLAVTSGLPPSFMVTEPEREQQIMSVLNACNRHGVIAGIFCGSLEMTAHWRASGYRMLTVASDAMLLRQAAQQVLAKLREESDLSADTSSP
jgi:4-hydroxy-2-oxoheptanedioate aldolase